MMKFLDEATKSEGVWCTAIVLNALGWACCIAADRILASCIFPLGFIAAVAGLIWYSEVERREV